MFDQDDFSYHVEEGLIKSSRSQDGYTVWCYTQKAVIEQAWDEITLACRGLVFAPDGTLVSRPFQKFFNWDQPQAVIEQGPFQAFDKMDGTLIIVGEHEGKAITSTKGSFDTWHSEAARELLLGYVPHPGTTAIFELIHPDNRIVVNYEDYKGLILLGGVNNADGEDYNPDVYASWTGWHGDVVVQRSFNLQSMLKTIQNPESGQDREGFVVLWPKTNKPGNRVKLKFAHYIALHGIMTGLTNRRVWEHLSNETLDDLLEIAPDELLDDIQKVATEIREGHATIVSFAHEVVATIRESGLETRKEVAEWIQERYERPASGLIFLAYDGKDAQLDKAVWRLVRPEESRHVGSAGLS